MTDAFAFDPNTDLLLERVVEVRPELVWAAWTKPEHLVRWFVPRPWTLAKADVDLRPGGRFRTVMRSPDGDEMVNDGCYLEVVENRRLVFTDALAPGFRPAAEPFFTAVVTMTPEGKGTRYRAMAMHADPKARAKHEQMGFAEGWGTALDQLVALAHELGGTA